ELLLRPKSWLYISHGNHPCHCLDDQIMEHAISSKKIPKLWLGDLCIRDRLVAALLLLLNSF
ncbi:hypothetical protein, partial [Vibrio ouci]|uniref:hypothetical protein n=1 Tax=Vibrio ouci TaxID=2499078 RepID=UPI001ABFB5C5